MVDGNVIGFACILVITSKTDGSINVCVKCHCDPPSTCFQFGPHYDDTTSIHINRLITKYASSSCWCLLCFQDLTGCGMSTLSLLEPTSAATTRR